MGGMDDNMRFRGVHVRGLSWAWTRDISRLSIALRLSVLLCVFVFSTCCLICGGWLALNVEVMI
jgi:hypothetical protein